MKKGVKLSLIFVIMAVICIMGTVFGTSIYEGISYNVAVENEFISSEYSYAFVGDDTYDKLKELSSKYNSKYGYSDETKFMLGNGVVLAEFDETSLRVYSDAYFKNSSIRVLKEDKLYNLLSMAKAIFPEDAVFNLSKGLVDSNSLWGNSLGDILSRIYYPEDYLFTAAPVTSLVLLNVVLLLVLGALMFVISLCSNRVKGKKAGEPEAVIES